MATKTIAIVGAAGERGSAIARSLRGRYSLLLMSGDETNLADLKTELRKSPTDPDVHTVDCEKDAAWEADIIIIATPTEDDQKVAEKIREVAVGKIVISISDQLDRGKPSRLLNTSAAEELQRLLPYSRVVKTFNTALASDFISSNKGVDVFIAGNNSDAVGTVSEIIASVGLEPVIVGDLTMSRMLERMQWTLARLAIINVHSKSGN